MNICKNDLENWFAAPSDERDKLNLIIELYCELYKRRILANIYIQNLFEALLGLNEINHNLQEENVLAAIMLMDKIGNKFEQNYNLFRPVSRDKNNSKNLTAKNFENYNRIIERFI